MKKLLNICTLLLVLALIQAGCKSKDPDPEKPVSPPITMAELADYYIVGERNHGDHTLFVIYFKKEGDTFKADMHLRNYFREHEATIENSTFTFDFDSNGKSMYKFELQKDPDGNLKLKSYDFAYLGEANLLSKAVIVKRADALQFVASYIDPNQGTNFSIDNKRFTFTKPLLQKQTLKWINGIVYDFYTLENIGFKTNKDELMGVVVPSWNGSQLPVMLVEEGDKVWIGSKE